jgi:hypothetical protein
MHGTDLHYINGRCFLQNEHLIWGVSMQFGLWDWELQMGNVVVYHYKFILCLYHLLDSLVCVNSSRGKLVAFVDFRIAFLTRRFLSGLLLLDFHLNGNRMTNGLIIILNFAQTFTKLIVHVLVFKLKKFGKALCYYPYVFYTCRMGHYIVIAKAGKLTNKPIFHLI